MATQPRRGRARTSPSSDAGPTPGPSEPDADVDATEPAAAPADARTGRRGSQRPEGGGPVTQPAFRPGTEPRS